MRSPVLQRLKQDFKNDLIAGLLVVIPLATTIWLSTTVTAWVVNLLTRVPKRINPFNDLHPILSNLLNLAIGISVPLFCILLIGLMARNIAGRWLLDFGERILQAIPFAGSVYKTLKQLLETIFRDKSSKFRRVVLVEYPRKGLWAIAFVTGSVTVNLSLGQPEQPNQPDPAAMLSVFIPTTPNPTTGWYAVVPEAEVVNVAMSIEDAFKVLISLGIVGPTTFGTTVPAMPAPSDHTSPEAAIASDADAALANPSHIPSSDGATPNAKSAPTPAPSAPGGLRIEPQPAVLPIDLSPES